MMYEHVSFEIRCDQCGNACFDGIRGTQPAAIEAALKHGYMRPADEPEYSSHFLCPECTDKTILRAIFGGNNTAGKLCALTGLGVRDVGRVLQRLHKSERIRFDKAKRQWKCR